MSNQRFIQQENIHLHYKTIGKGMKKVLCFHGYGQTSDVFLHLPKPLQETYTFYAFDLFFHGESLWESGGNFIDTKTWQSLLSKFLEQEKIQSCSLIGFSIGTKLVWASLKTLSIEVESLWLVAPDGIKANQLYVLATKTIFGVFLFKTILSSYPFLYFLIFPLTKYFALDTRWLKKHFHSKEKRLKLFRTWLLFRKLQYSQKELRLLLLKKPVNTFIFLNRKDKIILSRPIMFFAKNLDNVQIIELPYSHPTMLRLFLKQDSQNILSK